jgi:hypothetical protein
MRKHLFVMLLAATPLFAESITVQSEETSATLVELFTSEGCSSCPPADAWLGKLKSSPDLWQRIVPVAFHVDYWNYLGWADRFSTAANSSRQRRYAATWGTESVYTPGLVLNGREWRNWYQHDAIPESASAKVGRLAVTLHDAQAEVTFTRLGGPLPLVAELAVLGSNLESNVTHGENSGHKLRHDFTVLHFASAPLHREGDRFTATIPLPAKTIETSSAIAAWIAPGETQPPVQATGGWLRKP